MAAGGSVVLFSGRISRKPAVEMSTLAAVDGAIEALARTLALELAPVRVNAITPGQIDTPLWRSRLSDAEARAHFDRVAQGHPGRARRHGRGRRAGDPFPHDKRLHDRRHPRHRWRLARMIVRNGLTMPERHRLKDCTGADRNRISGDIRYLQRISR
jgi:NAD(P)-dependent dehydrogenase (short-subunit alcohol dehydrogenase family)